MLRVHKNNIPQIKASIKAFGFVWFHGDGNMYNDDQLSKDAVTFYNPKQEECSYRVKFTDINQVPSSVEDLVKKLQEAKAKEMMESRKPSQEVKQNTVKVSAEDMEGINEEVKLTNQKGPAKVHDDDLV